MKPIILKQINHDPVEYPTGHAILLGGSSQARNGVSTGAYKIASYLRDTGWEIQVFDYITTLKITEVYELLKDSINSNTKWIGVSYTWLSDSETAHTLIKEIKNWFPDLKLILGGQLPYAVDLSADWYLLGYGEYAIDAVLEYEFSTGPMPKSTELFGGRLIDAYHDYTATPFYSYRIKYNETDHISPKNYLGIELSRGCKFTCKFCSFPFIGMKQDSSTDEEELYRELNENYQRFGTRAYMIADDTVNDQTSKLIKLRNVVNRLDFNPDFWGFIRIDLLKANPDQYELLAESRVWTHFYGVETFNKKSGLAVGKGMHPDIRKGLMLEMRSYMNKHLGLYRGTAGFIAGLPHESMESMLETEKWLQENWADQSRIWWPLIIFNEQGIMSAFGKNMAEYGYEEILETDPQYNEKKDSITTIKRTPWRNNFTDIYECTEFTSSLHNEPEVLDSFATLQYLPLYNFDYQKVLSMKKHFKFDSLDFKKQSFRLAKEYYLKKRKSI
jgi:hypothetical protein